MTFEMGMHGVTVDADETRRVLTEKGWNDVGQLRGGDSKCPYIERSGPTDGTNPSCPGMDPWTISAPDEDFWT